MMAFNKWKNGHPMKGEKHSEESLKKMREAKTYHHFLRNIVKSEVNLE